MALAKVRALHPDIFSDEDVADVSIASRWLFAGMWCYACDNGHLADKPKQIKRWIFATDDVSAADLLRELEGVELIERYDGWIFIPGLRKRQRVDWRYFKTCSHPGCEKPDRSVRADSQRETQRGHVETTQSHAGPTRGHATDGDGDGDGDGVRDGDGDGDGDVGRPQADEAQTPAAVAATKKRPTKRATQRPPDFLPSQGHIQLAAEVGVDLRAEWPKFCDYNDARGTTYKDWSAALRNWIRNAATFKARNQHRSTGIDWDAAFARAAVIDTQNNPNPTILGELA